MQLSWLRSTALVLLITACGEDGGGDDGKTQEDAAASGTPKADGGSNAGSISGSDAGSSSGSDAGVAIRNDSSVPDTGTKPPAGDSGPGAVADAGAVSDAGGSTSTDAGATDAGGPTTPVDAGGTTPVDAGGGTPTEESFAALYASIFMPKCASAPCHGSTTHRSGLFLNTAAAAHTSLLKAAGADESGDGSVCKEQPKKRVTPGAPEQSLLVDMIAPPPHCGVQMPPSGEKLSAAEQKRISDWIAQGAKNN